MSKKNKMCMPRQDKLPVVLKNRYFAHVNSDNMVSIMFRYLKRFRRRRDSNNQTCKRSHGLCITAFQILDRFTLGFHTIHLLFDSGCNEFNIIYHAIESLRNINLRQSHLRNARQNGWRIIIER